MPEEKICCIICKKELTRDEAYKSDKTLSHYCKDCATYEAKNESLKAKVEEKNMLIIFLTIGIVIALLLLFGIV